MKTMLCILAVGVASMALQGCAFHFGYDGDTGSYCYPCAETKWPSKGTK